MAGDDEVLLIVEGSYVEFFPSRRAAEVDMEPVDVLENAYEAFDCTGRRLEIGLLVPAEEIRLGRFAVGCPPNAIRIGEPLENDEASKERLRAALLRSLQLEPDVNVDSSLEELINRFVHQYRI